MTTSSTPALTHASICSGIGGIDIAAEAAGFVTVGQVEIADYPFRVLRRRFGRIPRWRDIHDITGDDLIRRCGGVPTLISGGFPCQPHSVAGQRKGSSDERDLWPELRRILCEVKPRWFLGENVVGLFTSDDRRFFGGVLRDLASLGYTVGWGCWGAEHVGSPHPRHRVFLLAHSNGSIGTCTGEIGRVGGVRKPSAQEKAAGRNPYRQRRQNVQRRSEDARSSRVRSTLHPSWWSSEPELGRVVHGVSGRVDEAVRKQRVRSLGNAVVPLQVYVLLEEVAASEKALIYHSSPEE